MQRRALLIGNGKFDDPGIPALKSPVSEAEEFAELLGQKDIGDYTVKLCLDLPSWEIRREVQLFCESAHFDDVLLIYLSGHGVKDSDGNLHFGTRDTNQKILNATSLAFRFLNERMNKSDAGKKVLLIDSCYSGAIGGELGAKNVAQTVTKNDFANDESQGMIIIASSSAGQASFEEREGGVIRSRFTKHLMEGIKTGKADRDNDGVITVDDVYKYICNAMKGEAANKPQAPRQTPQRWALGLDGTLKVASNPGWTRSHIPDNISKGLQSRVSVEIAAAIDDLVHCVKADSLDADVAIRAIKPFLEHDSGLVQATAEKNLRKIEKGINRQTWEWWYIISGVAVLMLLVVVGISLPRPERPEPPMSPGRESLPQTVATTTPDPSLDIALADALTDASETDIEPSLPPIDPFNPYGVVVVEPPASLREGTIVAPEPETVSAARSALSAPAPSLRPVRIGVRDTTHPNAFDCSKAAMPYDFVICGSDDNLFNKHTEMVIILNALRASNPDGISQLNREQMEWQYNSQSFCNLPRGGRPTNNQINGALGCTLMKVLKRIETLQGRLQ